VAALVAGGAREDVEAVFQISPKAVDNWWRSGRQVGARPSTRSGSRRSGRPYWITGPDPRLAGQLWTRAWVEDLIAKLYRVRLTGQGAGTYGPWC
jgi:hypothetical protein